MVEIWKTYLPFETCLDSLPSWSWHPVLLSLCERHCPCSLSKDSIAQTFMRAVLLKKMLFTCFCSLLDREHLKVLSERQTVTSTLSGPAESESSGDRLIGGKHINFI